MGRVKSAPRRQDSGSIKMQHWLPLSAAENRSLLLVPKHSSTTCQETLWTFLLTQAVDGAQPRLGSGTARTDEQSAGILKKALETW